MKFTLDDEAHSGIFTVSFFIIASENENLGLVKRSPAATT